MTYLLLFVFVVVAYAYYAEDEDINWTDYHDFPTILNFLTNMEITYPEICKIIQIGRTFEGRPLRVLRITENADNRRIIWIDGGIHAREWISPAVVTNIIYNLARKWEKQPEHVRGATWYILPVANPDGYVYSRTTDRLWRKNRQQMQGGCYGIDLNRNFGFHWGEAGASQDKCSETYRGSQPFSELETQAIRSFLTSLRIKPTAFLTFHSFSQILAMPFAYASIPEPDNNDELIRIAEEAIKIMKNATGAIYQVKPRKMRVSGTAIDWAKGVLKSELVYNVELRDDGKYGFLLPPKYILPTAKESLAFVNKISEEAENFR